MSTLPGVPYSRFHPRQLLCSGIPRFSTFHNWEVFCLNVNVPECNHIRQQSRVHAVTGSDDAYKIPAQEPQSSSAAHEESIEGNANQGGGFLSSVNTLNQLKRYGVSGILSYGILNTAYYSTTFLLVWFFFSPAPGKMGYLAAVQRFLKIMAMVWAGSQVTKLIRAAGALALAPFVDRGLSWFTERFKFQSRGKAFLAIVGLCLGLALILFFVITLLSA
ncbi:hypothetical protein V2J09_008208 [Rumex salicifolius]